MLLHQLLSKDKEKVQYCIENLTTQPQYWSIYRKKVVLMGAAPLERVTDPALLQAGESVKTPKPDIKLPWKRYLVFANDAAQLGADIKEAEFNALLNIWVDEIGTVVLTEHVKDDGTHVLKASSWTSWAAKKKMAPAAAKYTQSKEAFLSSLSANLLSGLQPHQHASTVATVRYGSDLCSSELQFNALRSIKVVAAIKKLTGVDCSALPSEATPRISICASGGGYRALIATIGSLIGLESAGILDTVTNISGLSGSTWAMSMWYSSGLSLTATRALLADKLQKDFYTKHLWPDTIKAHVRERVGFEQELGLVDVMGWHLHHHLLGDMPSKADLWNHPRLSEQALSIEDAEKPMPIYTAVAHEHKRYRWFEFTPFEIGCAQDINCFVPTFSFGRKFKEGTSTDFAVEPSLSLLQATWGSAFCATVDQMFHELESPEQEKEPTFQRMMHTLIYDHLDMAEDRLITPAKFPNFSFAHPSLAQSGHPWQEMKSLKLMDAGVHSNLPFPPLLRKQRATDIIIALDQSSAPDIYSSVSVEIMEQWIKEEQAAGSGVATAASSSSSSSSSSVSPSPPPSVATPSSYVPFPDCSSALSPVAPSSDKLKYSSANGKRCTIIPGDVEKGTPTIIYIPLLRNDEYSKDFCPRANAGQKNGYCSTFNFKYSSAQVMELSGLTEKNISDCAADIINCIKDVTQKKMALLAAK